MYRMMLPYTNVLQFAAHPSPTGFRTAVRHPQSQHSLRYSVNQGSYKVLLFFVCSQTCVVSSCETLKTKTKNRFLYNYYYYTDIIINSGRGG